jgi:hypothetical protein
MKESASKEPEVKNQIADAKDEKNIEPETVK